MGSIIHLKERVWETVAWLKGNRLSPKDALVWGRQLIDLLWRGKALAALQSIVILGKQLGLSPLENGSYLEFGESSLQALYQYLKNNLSGIVDYHTFKRDGFYISSVVAEKTID